MDCRRVCVCVCGLEAYVCALQVCVCTLQAYVCGFFLAVFGSDLKGACIRCACHLW